jgi:hypothetical protein
MSWSCHLASPVRQVRSSLVLTPGFKICADAKRPSRVRSLQTRLRTTALREASTREGHLRVSPGLANRVKGARKRHFISCVDLCWQKNPMMNRTNDHTGCTGTLTSKCLPSPTERVRHPPSAPGTCPIAAILLPLSTRVPSPHLTLIRRK